MKIVRVPLCKSGDIVTISDGKRTYQAQAISDISTGEGIAYRRDGVIEVTGNSHLIKRSSSRISRNINPVTSTKVLYVKSIFSFLDAIYIGAFKPKSQIYTFNPSTETIDCFIQALPNKKWQGAIAITSTSTRWVLLPESLVINDSYYGSQYIDNFVLSWCGDIVGLIESSRESAGIRDGSFLALNDDEFIYQKINNSGFVIWSKTLNPAINRLLDRLYIRSCPFQGYADYYLSSTTDLPLIWGLRSIPFPLNYYSESITTFPITSEYINNPYGYEPDYITQYFINNGASSYNRYRIASNYDKTLFDHYSYTVPYQYYTWTITDDLSTETHTIIGSNSVSIPVDFGFSQDFYNYVDSPANYTYNYLATINGSKEYSTTRNKVTEILSTWHNYQSTGQLIEDSTTSSIYTHAISLDSTILFIHDNNGLDPSWSKIFASVYSQVWGKNESISASFLVTRTGTHPCSYHKYHDGVNVLIYKDLFSEWELDNTYNVTFNISVELVNLDYSTNKIYPLTVNSWDEAIHAYIYYPYTTFGTSAINAVWNTHLTFNTTIEYTITKDLTEVKPSVLLTSNTGSLWTKVKSELEYSLSYQSIEERVIRTIGLGELQALGIAYTYGDYTEANLNDFLYKPLKYGCNKVSHQLLSELKSLTVSRYSPPINTGYWLKNSSNVDIAIDSNSLWVECDRSLDLIGATFPITLDVTPSDYDSFKIGLHNYYNTSYSFSSTDIGFDSYDFYARPDNETVTIDWINLDLLPYIYSVSTTTYLPYDPTWDLLVGMPIYLYQNEDGIDYIYHGVINSVSTYSVLRINVFGPNFSSEETITQHFNYLNITFSRKQKVNFHCGFNILGENGNSWLYSSSNTLNMMLAYLEQDNKQISLQDKNIYISQAINEYNKTNKKHYIDHYKLINNKLVRQQNITTTQLKLSDDEPIIYATTYA